MLTVRFETLMAETEAELKRICAFLGVSYGANMLEYHHGTNFGPPDPNIAFGWKRKATAHEIALIEGRVGPLLATRGYEPRGKPQFPGFVERKLLAFENRWKRWRFNMRRYGVILFVATHLARVLRRKSLYRQLRQKQEDIQNQRRK